MTKKDFIALADVLRVSKPTLQDNTPGMEIDSALRLWHTMRNALGDMCAQSNPRFNRDSWLGYIAGRNGPNGGKKATRA